MDRKSSKMEICTNCKHYFVTGILQEWGNESVGYCLIIQNNEGNAMHTKNGVRKANSKSIVQANHTCEKFKNNSKKRLSNTCH